jgi:release factor glutamine methyltransferase
MPINPTMPHVKLPTPSTSHLSAKLNTTIYEPAEDSYLLLDTLSSPTETAFLQKHFPLASPTPLALEVGSGSGVVIAFLTAHANTILQRPILSLGVDVNWEACLGTRETVSQACEAIHGPSSNGTAASTGTYLSSLCADLTTPLLPHSVDILIFNPPYVPSETLPVIPTSPSPTTTATTQPPKPPTPAQLAQLKFEHESHLLSLTYAGGIDGMEITNRLLNSLPETLSERGVAYVLFCAQNRPAEVMGRIREWDGNWWADVVGETGGKGGWERLVVVRIWRRREG